MLTPTSRHQKAIAWCSFTILLACIGFWFHGRTINNPNWANAGRGARQQSQSEASGFSDDPRLSTRALQPNDFKDPRLRELFFNRFAPEANLDDFREFLAITNRSPKALALVALATRDPGILQELEDHAEVSSLAAQTLFLRTGSPTDRLTWADSMIRSDPNNALGNLYKAQALVALGEKCSALEAIREASGKPFTDYIPSLTRLPEAAYESLPDARKLEIAHSDARRWDQEALGPALGPLAMLMTPDGDAAGPLTDRLALADSILNQVVDSADARFSDHIDRIVVTLKYRVLRQIADPDTRDFATRAWGNIEELNDQRNSLPNVGDLPDGSNLSTFAPREVDSITRDWLVQP